MATVETKVVKREPWLDLSGNTTGFTMTKERWTSIIVVVGIFVICTLTGASLGLTKPNAGMALGLCLAVIACFLSGQFPLHWSGWMLAIGGVILGLYPFSIVQTTAGNSSFLMMLGMYIVADGATNTNIGKRLAYFFLFKFSRSQRLLVFGIYAATALLSVFCANLATTAVMSSIVIGLLKEIEEKDPVAGKLLGKVIMLLIPCGAMVGGICFISSSPGLNVYAVNALAASNKGVTLTFAQWGTIGVPIALILLVPFWAIYCWYFKVPKGPLEKVDPILFKNKLDSIGPIGGPEVRWALCTVGMVAAIISGLLATGPAAMLFAFLCLCPILGSVNTAKYFKSAPFGMLLNMMFMPLIGYLFQTYGIDKWVGGMAAPLLKSFSPLMLMFGCCLVMTFVNAVLPNASNAIITMCISIFTPVIISLGLNPVTILIPTIMMAAFTNILGVQMNLYMVYQYGYWEMNDPIIPGVMSNVFGTLVVTAVAYFVHPFIGLSFYL